MKSKCKHGFDVSCLMCGFGEFEGKRVWFDWAWQEQQKRIDQLEMAFKQLIEMSNKSISCEYDLFDKGWNQCEKQTIENIYRLTGLDVEQTLKCDEPKEEPQACDHTMVEKTQFGDLHRTFECIFCDHKVTEAWVTTHE